jgi:hypothetical protein
MKGESAVSRLPSFLLAVAALGCDRPTDNGEVTSQLSWYGVDYAAARARAYRSAEGLRGFFLLAVCTDAAGSEGYCAELEKLLNYYGDSFFSQAVESTTSTIREQIISDLRYLSGWGEHEGTWKEFRVRFPKVSRLVTPR